MREKASNTSVCTRSPSSRLKHDGNEKFTKFRARRIRVESTTSAVVQDANRDPGQKIQIFPAVFVPEAAAFAAHHGGRKTSVGVNEHLLAPFYPFAVVHLVLSLQLCAKSFRSMPSQATSSVPMPVCVKISSKIACS